MSEYVEPKAPHELTTLEEARARVIELEEALKPFVNVALMFGSVAFNLQTLNRKAEPAGGYWFNGPDGAVLKPADYLFYKTLYAFGRKRGEESYLVAMKRLQEMAEKNTALLEMPPASDTPS